jgi:hypothetical protein
MTDTADDVRALFSGEVLWKVVGERPVTLATMSRALPSLGVLFI